MATNLLAPAAVLIAWTLVMLLWLAATRLPAMRRAGIDMRGPLPGGRRGADLESVIPDRVNWKAHNYAHLTEQPTLFYAVVTILSLTGGYSAWAVSLAWGYVAIRFAHSLVQVTVNYVPLRFGLFCLATLCLIGLVVEALAVTLLR